MTSVLEVPGCQVTAVVAGPDGGIVLRVRGRRRDGRCPGCGWPSRAGHGSYRRYLADLPALGRGTRLDLEVRRFRCLNAACSRQTFAGRVPILLTPRARRTKRLAEAQRRIGFATSAMAGARLSQALAMPVSASTVLRLIPTCVDQNSSVQVRWPRDLMRWGWSMSLFQALQQWATMSS